MLMGGQPYSPRGDAPTTYDYLTTLGGSRRGIVGRGRDVGKVDHIPVGKKE